MKLVMKRLTVVLFSHMEYFKVVSSYFSKLTFSKFGTHISSYTQRLVSDKVLYILMMLDGIT